MTRKSAFEGVRAVGLQMPGVEAVKRYDGATVLKAGGSFMAGIASHPSAEPDSLVVRSDVEDRDLLIADAPETYYVTEYYSKYPLVLARLKQLTDDAVRDLLLVSRELALAKSPRRDAAAGAKGASAFAGARARAGGRRPDGR